MKFVERYVKDHRDMFSYLNIDQAEPRHEHHHNVHPHDHLMARTLLRLVPESVTPNQITAFRILCTPIVFLLVMFNYYVLGIVAFLLVAFTDVLDGSLARTKGKITKFGMMFDPLADKLLIGSLIVLLIFQYYHIVLGVAILGLEVLFIATALVAKYRFKTVRMANVWGKIKMLLQVFAVFLTMAALLLNAPQLFTIGAWVFGLAIGFAVVSLFAHGI